MKNFYQTLAVDRNASAEEIKKSYRRLSKQYHPDVNQGNKTAEIKFKEISEAYAILSNLQSRREYDKKFYATGKSSKTSAKEQPQQAANYASGKFNMGNVRMQFEQFFGFDPKSKEQGRRVAHSSQAKNPLDTSHIFEGFFKPKKK